MNTCSFLTTTLFKIGTAGALVGALSISATAAVITVNIDPVSVTGHHGGQGFGVGNGDLGQAIDRSGIGFNGVPNGPAIWTADSSSWPDEWQSLSLLSGATNSKVGWIAFDLGEAVDLVDLFFWNVRENSGRTIENYNIYTATSPTVALPATPTEGTAGSDYDFASGGWTLLQGGNMSSRFDGGTTSPFADLTVSATGTNAQYIGLEILSNNGDLNRVGLAEFAVVHAVEAALPEPGTAAFLVMGSLMLRAFRRREAEYA